MPQIEIRPAVADDIQPLVTLDHDYTSDYVWQMDVRLEEGQMGVSFRLVRLPRSVRVEYPRSPKALTTDWERRSGLLVAVLEEQVVGYVSIMQNQIPATTQIIDLVVLRRVRRQGIGSTLVLAAEEWARQHSSHRLMIEMQPKNHPAYCLAQKLGFDFCGYNDRYYLNRDIALFYAKSLR